MAQGDGLDIKGPAKVVVQKIENELRKRAYRASNELRNGLLQVLRGQRSGRRYIVPYTYKSPVGTHYGRSRKVEGGKVTYFYVTKSKTGKASVTKRMGRYHTASAPGEPPAVLTGGLRLSFWPRPRSEKYGNQLRVYPAIASELKRAKWMEEGTEDKDGNVRIKPRPYKEMVKEKALPAIRRIYSQKYTT